MIYRLCLYLIDILLNPPLLYFRLFIFHNRKCNFWSNFILLGIRVSHSFDLFEVKNQADGLTSLNMQGFKHPLGHINCVIVLGLQFLKQLSLIGRLLFAIIKQGKLTCLLQFLCSVGLCQVQVPRFSTHLMDWVDASYYLLLNSSLRFNISLWAHKIRLAALSTLASSSINGLLTWILLGSSQLMSMQNIHIDVEKCPSVTDRYIKGKLMAKKMISNLKMLSVS